jgi:hypothetical protein
MKRLTISQVAACVDPAIRWTKESVVVDYPALTEALNAVLAAYESAVPETPASTGWCDVCQRDVGFSHTHDRMVE